MIDAQPAGLPISDCQYLMHGHLVNDQYRWLEYQDAPETREFIRKQQMLLERYLSSHHVLYKDIEEKVRRLLEVESVSLPIDDLKGGLLYLKRSAYDQQPSIWHRTVDGKDEIELSLVDFSLGGDSSLSLLRISDDGRYLAVGLRDGGEDAQIIRIYDLLQRKILTDQVDRGMFRGLVFSPEENGFYYVQEHADGHTDTALRFHEFGADQERDEEVFSAPGAERRLLLLGVGPGNSLILQLVSLNKTRHVAVLHYERLTQQTKIIAELSGATFIVASCSDAVLAWTTATAPMGRIVRLDVNGQHSEWVTLIPETSVPIKSLDIGDDVIVVNYSIGGEETTKIYDFSGNLLSYVDHPTEGTTVLGRYHSSTHRLFFSHSDATHPATTYFHDVHTRTTSIWWQAPPLEVPDYDIVEKRCESTDGTLIPITITRKPGGSLPAPCLLGAYGASGVINSPKFSVLASVLLDVGFTCATVHVRGGGEYGPDWHSAGVGRQKQTSIDDFTAGAQWLIENGYASEDGICAAGQSFGATLVLIAATQHPQLFRAVLALGPLADLLRFHLFGVAKGFVSEIGDPDDPDDFEALFRLSPYHRAVESRSYPAFLIISGDRDRRCDALHARKMVARLQASQLSAFPVLLDYSSTRGHKPVLSLQERISGLSRRLTFVIDQLSGPASSNAS